MGYSLCIMAHFQNGLISRIFSLFSSDCLLKTTLKDLAHFQNGLISRILGLFSSDFLHKTTANDLQNGFKHFFGNFNLSPKVRILHGL